MLTYFILWIAGFIISMLVFLYFSWAFHKVTIEEKKLWPFKIVYKEHKGNYKETGTIMDNIYKKLLEDNIKTTRWIWIYYDNPGKIPMAQLRSDGWCIVEKEDYNKLESLWSKYKSKDIAKWLCIVSEFPYKNKLSIMIGILKVYPTLWKYTKEKKYEQWPITEIYDQANKKIIYSMFISII